MDQMLVEYLGSGKAWLLVGSGPSIADGMPSWRQMAESAVRLCNEENDGSSLTEQQHLLTEGKYPEVFQSVADLVGMPRLLAHLQKLMPCRLTPGPVYESIA